MNVDSILIADFAQLTPDGKLTVVGAFNQIRAKELPVRLALLFVTMVIHAHPNEAGHHKLYVALIDRNRAELGRIEAEFDLPGEAPEGLPVRAIVAPGLFGVGFPEAGPYAFEAYIDDTYAAAASLVVLDERRA